MAQRLSQIYRIDLNKTFFPIMRKESFHIFIAISYLLDTIVDQVDIVGAYFKSWLSNNNLPIFMKLLPKIELFRAIRSALVCRLLQSIYGLRQSRRLWNQKVVVFFTNLGFIALNANPSILIH